MDQETLLARYLAENEANWDRRTPIHLRSTLYDLPAFKAGACTVPAVDRELLGDVAGVTLLHLQCHFGQDTLSLARLGAVVTGVDFSGAAIAAARGLAEELALSATFLKANVLELGDAAPGPFDVVYTSWGVLGWLPELGGWARGIAARLRPGGRFVLMEFHPFVWMSQVGPDLSIRYPYFNRGVISEVSQGTYADRDATLDLPEHGWNHPVSDLLTALLDAGLTLERVLELDHVPFDVFPGLEHDGAGRYRFAAAPGMVPMSLGVVARRPGGHSGDRGHQG